MEFPLDIICFTVVIISIPPCINSQTSDKCLVERHVQNKGFHRTLTTQVNFPGLAERTAEDCDILLIENFPASVYVDVHQLDFMKTENDTDHRIHTSQEAAVEVPFHKAQAQEVYQWGALKKDGESLTAFFSLPFHLRYHKADTEFSSKLAEIEPPKVLVSCGGTKIFHHIAGDEVYSSCDNTNLENLCEWREVEYKALDPIKLLVPIGQRSHYDKVLYGTISLCGFYTFSLLVVALRQNQHTIPPPPDSIEMRSKRYQRFKAAQE